MGKPINVDAIYNGAMDNASGIASLLDVAAMLKESGDRSAWSVVFVAVTGEEKWAARVLLFAGHPSAGWGKIVADITWTCSCRSTR